MPLPGMLAALTGCGSGGDQPTTSDAGGPITGTLGRHAGRGAGPVARRSAPPLASPLRPGPVLGRDCGTCSTGPPPPSSTKPQPISTTLCATGRAARCSSHPRATCLTSATTSASTSLASRYLSQTCPPAIWSRATWAPVISTPSSATTCSRPLPVHAPTSYSTSSPAPLRTRRSSTSTTSSVRRLRSRPTWPSMTAFERRAKPSAALQTFTAQSPAAAKSLERTLPEPVELPAMDAAQKQCWQSTSVTCGNGRWWTPVVIKGVQGSERVWCADGRHEETPC
jgi:hypothetical protein